MIKLNDDDDYLLEDGEKQWVCYGVCRDCPNACEDRLELCKGRLELEIDDNDE